MSVIKFLIVSAVAADNRVTGSNGSILQRRLQAELTEFDEGNDKGEEGNEGNEGGLPDALKDDETQQSGLPEDPAAEFEAEIELEFENRRDDAKYNMYLDAEDKESAEAKAILEEANQGYTPSLWETASEDDVTLSANQKWKNRVVIPYHVDGAEGVENFSTHFEAAKKELEEVTCISFAPLKDHEAFKAKKEEQYISFTSEERGCDEIIGRKDPGYEHPQLQPFSEKCTKEPGYLMHYLMHILGFDNEHQRPDAADPEGGNMKVFKDDEGKADPEKVSPLIPERLNRPGHNDQKAEKDSASFQAGSYDRKSVMHWDKKWIQSSDNDANIVHMRAGESTMLSEGDVQKINKLYGCEEVTSDPADPDEGLSCKAYLTEDSEFEAAEACLKREAEDGSGEYVGEYHVLTAAKENMEAVVTVNYSIELDVEADAAGAAGETDEAGEEAEDFLGDAGAEDQVGDSQALIDTAGEETGTRRRLNQPQAEEKAPADNEEAGAENAGGENAAGEEGNSEEAGNEAQDGTPGENQEAGDATQEGTQEDGTQEDGTEEDGTEEDGTEEDGTQEEAGNLFSELSEEAGLAAETAEAAELLDLAEITGGSCSDAFVGVAGDKGEGIKFLCGEGMYKHRSQCGRASVIAYSLKTNTPAVAVPTLDGTVSYEPCANTIALKEGDSVAGNSVATGVLGALGLALF